MEHIIIYASYYMLNVNISLDILPPSDEQPVTPSLPKLIGPHPRVDEAPEPKQPESNIDVLAPPQKENLNFKERQKRNKSIAEWENIVNWDTMESETIRLNIKKARDLF